VTSGYGVPCSQDNIGTCISHYSVIWLLRTAFLALPWGLYLPRELRTTPFSG